MPIDDDLNFNNFSNWCFMFWFFRKIRCFSLLCESQRLSLFAAWVFLGAILPVQAQPEQALGAWQLSAGWQDYSEPQMNLKGPELGAHWQSRSMGTATPWKLMRILGLQNYSSVQSGTFELGVEP